MPKKRSAEEKVLYLQNKIRRLEEKERKYARQLESSTDDIQQEIITDECEVEGPTPLSPLPIVCNEAPGDAEVICNEAPGDPEVPETSKEPDPDPELISALGASVTDSPDFGEPIHDSLSSLWLPILKKGIPREEKGKLMKEYIIPSNCKLLQSPKLNAEISAAVSDTVRTRDKKLESFQQTLGAGTSAINRAMDTMLKCNDKVKALKCLGDGCRLLSDLHHSFSTDRKKLITPSLEKSFLHVIHDTERDETLFGNDLSEKIKASKAIEKQGLQIRKAGNLKTTSSTSQASLTRPGNQGNWTGPPRFPSFRGGRGAQRRPAVPTRRPYQTTTQNPSRAPNQTKLRANLQH